MSKKNNKDLLNTEQRKVLSKLHNAQVTLEVALTVFILAFYTINLSSAFPGYGIVALLAIGFSSILTLICGIVITLNMRSWRRSQNPVVKDSTHAWRWLIAAWAGIPVIIFLFVLMIVSQNAELSILYLILMGVVVLLMLLAIIFSLIKIHHIWRKFNKKKAHARIITYGIIGLSALLLTLLGTYSTTEAIKYGTTSVTDSNLELGQTETRQVGKDGQMHTKRNLIFGATLSTDTTHPVDEIVAKGSRKYQYMYCSNGSYRYFTAEQFKDPNVGFTHQSPDHCAQNGAGTQTTIADVPPAEKIVQQVPVYRSPSYTTCTESYFGGSFTCRSF